MTKIPPFGAQSLVEQEHWSALTLQGKYLITDYQFQPACSTRNETSNLKQSNSKYSYWVLFVFYPVHLRVQTGKLTPWIIILFFIFLFLIIGVVLHEKDKENNGPLHNE